MAKAFVVACNDKFYTSGRKFSDKIETALFYKSNQLAKNRATKLEAKFTGSKVEVVPVILSPNPIALEASLGRVYCIWDGESFINQGDIKLNVTKLLSKNSAEVWKSFDGCMQYLTLLLSFHTVFEEKSYIDMLCAFNGFTQTEAESWYYRMQKIVSKLKPVEVFVYRDY